MRKRRKCRGKVIEENGGELAKSHKKVDKPGGGVDLDYIREALSGGDEAPLVFMRPLRQRFLSLLLTMAAMLLLSQFLRFKGLVSDAARSPPSSPSLSREPFGGKTA